MVHLPLNDSESTSMISPPLAALSLNAGSGLPTRQSMLGPSMYADSYLVMIATRRPATWRPDARSAIGWILDSRGSKRNAREARSLTPLRWTVSTLDG